MTTAVRFSPAAAVLPANLLRFYVHFDRPSAGRFARDELRLLDDDDGRVLADAFLELPVELWSRDGRRLTVLVTPRHVKRGLGGPLLTAGRRYRLVAAIDGQTAVHRFRASAPVREPLDEQRWHVVAPRAGGSDALRVRFDRVVDAGSCRDELCVVGPTGTTIPTTGTLDANGTALSLMPEAPWRDGTHRISITRRFEDVCGNRLGEALDRRSERARPRDATIAFRPAAARSSSASQTSGDSAKRSPNMG